jgi:hypothetical protein
MVISFLTLRVYFDSFESGVQQPLFSCSDDLSYIKAHAVAITLIWLAT